MKITENLLVGWLSQTPTAELKRQIKDVASLPTVLAEWGLPPRESLPADSPEASEDATLDMDRLEAAGRSWARLEPAERAQLRAALVQIDPTLDPDEVLELIEAEAPIETPATSD
jgi:hypothetical protein